MNFSEAFRKSKQLCFLSPNGNFLASAVDFRLIVRDSQTLQIQKLYTCIDDIQYVEWSADSLFILCEMFKRGAVQVWSLEAPDWQCKIDEGSAGLVKVCWSPDARHIITTADFNLRLTIWSLVKKTVSYIRYPKQCKKGLDFSGDGRQMILAERRNCRDFVSVFDTGSWQLIKHFPVGTDDLDGVQISPDQSTVALWESCVKYLVLLYTLDGHCIGRYSAYTDALGVKSLVWGPTSQYLALGSFDGKVRLLNHVTWRPCITLDHTDTVDTSNVIVYREVVAKRPSDAPDSIDETVGSLFTPRSKYVVANDELKIPRQKPDVKKANPKLGVSCIRFSHDNSYLATINDNMNTAVWIWDVRTLSLLTVLLQKDPVKIIDWDPSQSRLALCTGSCKVYMWSKAGCLAVDVPVSGMNCITKVSWHPSGQSLLLQSPSQMCMCYISDTAT